MVKKEKETIFAENRFGGKGTIQMTHFADETDLLGEGKAMMRLTLPVGTSLGNHQHVGCFEVYYILSGEGLFISDGVESPIKAGDAGFMRPDGFHSLENTGTEDLNVIGVVFNVNAK